MRRSFALRLAAAFAGVGIAAAALTAILVNVSFESRFTSYLEDQQRARQRQLVAGLADSYVRMGGWDAADLRTLESLAMMDGGTIRLVDAEGDPVWEPTAGEGGRLAAMHRQMMGSGPLGPEQRLPVRVDGAVVGTAIVRLPAAGLLPQDVSFRSSVNQLLLVGGIVAGLAALLAGLLLARRATAPARELTRAARAMAAGERSERADVGSRDELGEMATAFNAMADTIEEEDRLRRAFASEVAHELRTPLTILRTQVEGIQDGVVQPSSPALASLHDESLRLTRLVEDLETLASADAAGFTLNRARTDLRAELEAAAREFAGPYGAREIDLATHLEDVEAVVDATRIRQVVANLLSNALKFTPEGGRVRLELRRRGDDAIIIVSDMGPGIPPDELGRVFDRFFRGRGARARGSGIGLTVAQELVLAHGGTIRASSDPGRGATFVVRLPDAASARRDPFIAPSHPGTTVETKGGSGR
jgi:signal transduction histidine kinase